jgi:hypothetical protein
MVMGPDTARNQERLRWLGQQQFTELDWTVFKQLN